MGAKGPRKWAKTPPELKIKKRARSTRQSRSRGGQGITTEKYEELWAAYQVAQTVNNLVRTCDVSPPTAKKYVEFGDPKRGMQGLRERFRALQTATAQEIDHSLAKRQAETLRATGLFKAAIIKTAEKAKEAGELATKDPTASLRNIHNIEAAILGGVGEATATTAQEANPFADLSDAEQLEYLEAACKAIRRFEASNDAAVPDPSVMVQ